MLSRLRAFLARHPSVRDAIVWAIPALLVGAILRLLFLSYSPYAFWGADSRSYYSFAYQLLGNFYVSLDEKRRFLYPILMVPISLLPGPPLRWLAIAQHAFGLATLLPLAYVVRKVFVFWRLWIVPVTVLFAGFPIIVWYEHELLGENVFFALLLWALAGWTAWSSEENSVRARRLFWCFFIPFALFILTKPSGRFVWPGIAVGMVMIFAWQRLDRNAVIALAALIPITLAVGSKKQGAWLLYTAVFPLTQLETPLHAEYKAQIRDLVEPLARNLDTYYLFDGVPFNFLENPDKEPERTLWAPLGKDEKLKSKIYMDLAVEAIKARPLMFLYFGAQRAVASANLSTFGLDRFSIDYVRQRMESRYANAQRAGSESMRMALNLPIRGPLPPYEQLASRLDPTPGSWKERFVCGWMHAVGDRLDFSEMPKIPKEQRRISLARPTFIGWWLFVGMLLAFLPSYRRTLGVWTIIALGYVFGVFLVSQLNARYFGPVWPVLILLLALPADVLVRKIAGARK